MPMRSQWEAIRFSCRDIVYAANHSRSKSATTLPEQHRSDEASPLSLSK